MSEIYRKLPKSEVRYGPTLAQHRQKFSEDRLPISSRCWNDNSGMHLAANSSPNSGRQHLFSAQQRANAVPNSGFLTSRMVCRGKSDTWPSNPEQKLPNLFPSSDLGPTDFPHVAAGGHMVWPGSGPHWIMIDKIIFKCCVVVVILL